jgi:peroxiredoxin
LDANGRTIPVWRDTVKIPGDGFVTMRTRYTDFIGTFVQHCHILDHEDQGMMQLIDIVEPRPKVARATATLKPDAGSIAADFALPDASGTMHKLSEVQGKPAVVFFFKGHGCLHCVQQVTAFTDHYREFRKKGIQVIGVSSDTQEALKTALKDFPCPFTLLADPKGVAFAKYGCVSGNELQHGTFTLDAGHNITWSTIGASPFIAVTELLKDSPPRALTKSATSSPEKKQASASPVK